MSRALPSLLLAFAAHVAVAQTTVLRFTRLVDVPGHVVDDAVVVVQGERITTVGSGTKAIPAGAKVIDLRPLTGIPGLRSEERRVGKECRCWWSRSAGGARSPLRF